LESQPWVLSRYEKLWSIFGNKRFTREEALEALKRIEGDAFSEESLNVLLSELRKAGLLAVEADLLDARRKIYMLRAPKKLKDLLAEKDMSRADLENLMKRAADLIRTRVDYEFILILLFLKRVSDKWVVEYKKAYEEALADGLSPEEADKEARSAVYHDFVLTDECLWDNIRRDPTRLAENFSKALKVLAEKNPELQGVVDRADFIRFAESRENLEILRQLVELFSEKRLYDVSPDILGDAYEWVLRYFAPEKAKEGEIYTPREVIRLLVEMLDPKPGEKVYDPCCGSGGMLILSYKHVENVYGKDKAKELFLYGQEANPKIRAYCKMNLYIHDIKDADIQLGDTLLYPKHLLGFADVVLANPPWNQDGYDEDVLKKGDLWRQRFPYGFTSKQSADWAWIQHMLAMAKDKNGRIGVVIDNGCLFRPGKESEIRRKIIEADLVECVLLLPEKLFYNTGAPGAIIIFRKNKTAERKGKILFINASNEFIKHPTVRKLNSLSNENIKRIVEAYRKFEDIAGFCKVVSIEEVRSNDYNLNVTLYVMPIQEGEQIDIIKEWSELKELEREKQETTSKLEQCISEITQATGEQNKFYKEINFKETPIGKFPNDWNVMKLDNLVEIETGKRAKGGALDKGNVASIGGEHIDDEGNILWDDMKFIPEDFYNSLKQGKVKLRDILLVKDGATTGKVAIVKNLKYEKVAVNEHVFIIRSRTNRLTNEFLFYFLFSKFGQIQVKRRFHGLIGGITRNDLETILLPIPSVQEQQKIVEVLSTVDEAIQKTDEIIAKTERLKKGLMQELLTKGIGHKEFKDTEIGRIPKEWEVVKLKEVVSEAKSGFACGKRDENGILQLRMDNIEPEGWINVEAGVKVPIPEDVEDYILKPGDILFNNTNSIDLIGKTAIFRGEFSRCVYSNHLTRIRVDRNKVVPEWVLYLLIRKWKLGVFKAICHRHVHQAGINNEDLLRLKIPLPSLQEQQKITLIIMTIDNKLKLEKEQKARLERIKQGLMDLLLTGKVRVRIEGVK